MDGIKTFFSNNITWLIMIIFLIGVSYSEQRTMKAQDKVLEERLDKKIKTLNELGDKVIELEKYVEWEKGHREGKKEGSKELKVNIQ